MKNQTNGIPQANEENILLVSQSKIINHELFLIKQALSDYLHWVRLLNLQIEEFDSNNEDTTVINQIIESHLQQIARLKAQEKLLTKLHNHTQEELFINAHQDGVNIKNVLYANDVTIAPLPVKVSVLQKIKALLKIN